MAVTRAEKTTELESLEGAFKGHDVAILIDYKGINVPQVTQLRIDLRERVLVAVAGGDQAIVYTDEEEQDRSKYAQYY